MLETLDDIPWGRLTHAYGPAGDVPDLIRALGSPHGPERRHALHELWGSLCHQGTIYAATPYAVPFLQELLAAPEVNGKDDLMLLLAEFARGGFHNSFDPGTGRFLVGNDRPEARRQVEEGYGWIRKTRADVRAGCPLYARLITDTSARVRGAALELLVVACADEAGAGERVSGVIRTQLIRERSRVLRIRLIDGLIHVGAADDETIATILRIFAATRDAALRLAAAVALALIPGPTADVPVEVVLLESLIDPDPRAIQCYDRGVGAPVSADRYVSSVSLALRQLGDESVERAQDRLLRALGAACSVLEADSLPPVGRQSVPYIMPDGTMYWREIEGRFEYPLPPALKLAKALLFLGFGPHPSTRPLPPHLRAIPALTESQRRAIAGIVQCEALWAYSRNMDHLLDLHRLPVTREGLRAQLAN